MRASLLLSVIAFALSSNAWASCSMQCNWVTISVETGENDVILIEEVFPHYEMQPIVACGPNQTCEIGEGDNLCGDISREGNIYVGVCTSQAPQEKPMKEMISEDVE